MQTGNLMTEAERLDALEQVDEAIAQLDASTNLEVRIEFAGKATKIMQSIGSCPDSLYSFLTAWKARKLLLKVKPLLNEADKQLVALTNEGETGEENTARIDESTQIRAKVIELWKLVKELEKERMRYLAEHGSSYSALADFPSP